MTAARKHRLAWWLVLLVLQATLTGGCRREPPIATTLEVTGGAERGRADGWTAAVAGTTFIVGDTLRTGAAAQARVGLTGGGVLRVGENARIRFQRGAISGQRAPDLAVEMGSAEVDEVLSDISVVTAIGPARIQRGTHVRVRADGQTATLEVVVGRAVMLEAGQEVAIDAGQGIRIRLGSAEIQRFALHVGDAIVERRAAAPEVPPAAASAPPDAGPAVADSPAAPAARAARGDTSRADITLTAGESATVHDRRSAAVVRLRLQGLCPGEAIVELGGGRHHAERLTGSGAVIFRLGPGSRTYRVRCDGDAHREPRAAGTLVLRRDSGDVPLSRRAPTDVIDADGRRYTVLFQTRLPQVTLAWPGAPAGVDRLQLHVESSAGQRLIEGASPRRPLPAGTLAEGTYTVWYLAPDGKQSPKTSITIRFDNAAPVAQFFPSGSAEAPAIAVDGVTVDGAKVTVGGQPLAIDGHGRFRGQAAPLEGDDAVAVRLEHPRTGVHYYVRRHAAAR
jgi:hypothetical protein